MFKEATKLALQAVPQSVNLQAVKKFLLEYENIKEVHDLHIWAISTSEIALTCHIVLKEDFTSVNLNKISHDLEHHFEINHATLQVENELDKMNCKLAPDEVV